MHVNLNGRLFVCVPVSPRRPDESPPQRAEGRIVDRAAVALSGSEYAAQLTEGRSQTIDEALGAGQQILER
jgi:hypothetical protein